MIKQKKAFIEYIQGLDEIFGQAVAHTDGMLSNAQDDLSGQFSAMQEELQGAELLLLLVGGYSTGKSTIVNTLLDEEILPVELGPETAIPTEIRYAEEDRIEALTVGGNWEKHPVSALTILTENAAHYDVLNVYLNRPALKELQPFVLVDMPGFDSPNDNHNKAILRYLANGSYYLFTVAAQAGTLEKQHIQRMEEIDDVGKQFRVILTKKDLSSESALAETLEQVEEELESRFASAPAVVVTSHHESGLLLRMVQEADPDGIFKDLHIHRLERLGLQVDSYLNSAKAGLKRESAEAVEHKKADERALKKLEFEKSQRIEDVRSASFDTKVNTVLSAVTRDLSAATGEIVVASRTSDAAVEKLISSLVRSTLVRELRAATDRLASDVVQGVSLRLNASALQIDQRWLDNTSEVLQSMLDNAVLGMGEEAREANAGSTEGTTNRISMLALAIPHPVAKVIVAVLPGIVGAFFDQLKARREEEHVTSAIHQHVIPDVLRQVEPIVEDALRKSTEAVVQAVTQEFEEKLSLQRETFEQVLKATEAGNADREAWIAHIETALQSLREHNKRLRA